MEAFVAAMIVAATPLLFAALGELVAERSGVLNLGVEGMMLVGAVCAFIVAKSTGSTAAGALAGAGAGLAMAALFALVALGFSANQAAAGLALTIFGGGLSGLLGRDYVGVPLPKPGPLFPASWAEAIPYGKAIFGHDAMVYLALASAVGIWWFLARARGGLKLRAAGDNAESGHALGLPVLRIRFLAVLFGGAMAGLGGAYLSLAYTPMWGEGMTAGRGWIALALVVFAGWRVGWVAAGAVLFAAVTQLQFYAQGWGWRAPSQFWAAAPYLATILALALLAGRRTAGSAPAALGRIFRPSS
ncbi:ABC transporter permease [Neomegalonema sp.]|uniref:ABC transporter permease n=1 Tax=Neomegalonema sp. TaxID=2039713 RepID=UPI0026087960|nr:ABC transporter permease [Neomegalonema sp.]MDD2868582.1 ABC transporter permease [Neomegalonema sp.]